MKMITAMIVSGLMMSLTIPVSAATKGTTVRFGPDSKYSGYFVRPVGHGPFPGIVVIHEWWGLNDNIKATADRLAGIGYVALAVDLFGKSATDPVEAMRLVRGLNQLSATVEMVAAADYLRSLSYVPDNRVGAIGWCFGGRQAQFMAANDPRLAAVVVYYGSPLTDANEIARIRSPLLGIFGGADDSIPVEDVRKFEQALEKAGVPNEIHIYPGAKHAFANPTQSDRYLPQAAEDAWRKTVAFLDRRLKATLGNVTGIGGSP